MSGNVFTKSNTVDSETDFSWSEGVRTHLVINIHNAVAPNKGDVVVPEASTGLAVSATKIALVRIFVNGDCERELKFSITDTEEFGTSQWVRWIYIGAKWSRPRCLFNTLLPKYSLRRNRGIK